MKSGVSPDLFCAPDRRFSSGIPRAMILTVDSCPQKHLPDREEARPRDGGVAGVRVRHHHRGKGQGEGAGDPLSPLHRRRALTIEYNTECIYRIYYAVEKLRGRGSYPRTPPTWNLSFFFVEFNSIESLSRVERVSPCGR